MSATSSSNMFRQGDVLVFEAGPEVQAVTEVPRENGEVVLAHGELTGHAHVLKALRVRLFETKVPGDRLLVVEEDGASLVHQEHRELTIPPGRWLVRRQHEFVPQELPLGDRTAPAARPASTPLGFREVRD